jgi:hypothetical protein
VDRFIGPVLDAQLGLHNVANLNLSLLSLVYMQGMNVNWVIVVVICVVLLANIIVGLRLITKSNHSAL